MKYRVEIAASAKADIRETARWLSEQASPAAATRWLPGLHDAMNSLEKQPGRCPLAAESHKFPAEVRELLYGRSKRSKHRILFTIADKVVHVLYVRHTARDEVEP
jgi:plasmid stabilization system protein ParE